MPMPDIEAAMHSFEKALEGGVISIKNCEFEKNLFLHLDQPNREVRLTYVRLDRGMVTTMVQIVPAEPYEGDRVFNVSWSVPRELRTQGRATQTFLAALREFRHGMTRSGLKAFWIEAVVGQDNVASQRVAEKVITAQPIPITDDFAGEPALQYLRRIDADTVI